MRKKSKVVRILIYSLALSCLLLGCGKKEIGVEDSKKYVGAVLDLMCKGEYDPSVDLTGLKDGKISEFRNEMIDEMMSSFADETGMEEDVQSRFRDFISKAFSKCKYSVKDAVKTEDGGYDVTVSIEPLMLFAGTSEVLQKEMDTLTKDTETLLNMPDEEVYQLLYDAMFKVLNKNLDNPSYAATEEVIVHYGVIDEENKIFGISGEDGEILGENLFSLEGME